MLRKKSIWAIFKHIYRMNHQDMDNFEFLDRGNNNCLAYRRSRVLFAATDNPRPTTVGPKHFQTDVHHRDEVVNTGGKANGIVFLPGFLSNMNGGKALALEQFCKQSRYEFVRFDYQGCGESKGDIDMDNNPFDVWKEDALAVLDNLTAGPQVLVGSSMGGAIMMMLALERPERIHSLVGIAAPNYDNKSLLTNRANMLENTQENRFNFGAFIGQRNRDIMSSKFLAIKCPMRLIHGMQDDVVKYESALELAQKVQSEDVRVILQKSGTHRMSTPEGLELLLKTVEEVLGVKSRL